MKIHTVEEAAIRCWQLLYFIGINRKFAFIIYIAIVVVCLFSLMYKPLVSETSETWKDVSIDKSNSIINNDIMYVNYRYIQKENRRRRG